MEGLGSSNDLSSFVLMKRRTGSCWTYANNYIAMKSKETQLIVSEFVSQGMLNENQITFQSILLHFTEVLFTELLWVMDSLRKKRRVFFFNIRKIDHYSINTVLNK